MCVRVRRDERRDNAGRKPNKIKKTPTERQTEEEPEKIKEIKNKKKRKEKSQRQEERWRLGEQQQQQQQGKRREDPPASQWMYVSDRWVSFLSKGIIRRNRGTEDGGRKQ